MERHYTLAEVMQMVKYNKKQYLTKELYGKKPPKMFPRSENGIMYFQQFINNVIFNNGSKHAVLVFQAAYQLKTLNDNKLTEFIYDQQSDRGVSFNKLDLPTKEELQAMETLKKIPFKTDFLREKYGICSVKLFSQYYPFNNQLKSILRIAPDAILFMDKNKKFHYMNNKMLTEVEKSV